MHMGRAMGTGGFIFLAIVVVALVYIVMLYNNLVSLKNNVAKAWANIDVLLKQRHDELPKLVRPASSTWVTRKTPWRR
jgi:LemA protein